MWANQPADPAYPHIWLFQTLFIFFNFGAAAKDVNSLRFSLLRQS